MKRCDIHRTAYEVWMVYLNDEGIATGEYLFISVADTDIYEHYRNGIVRLQN